MNTAIIKKTGLGILIGVLLMVGVQFAHAWTAPANPPVGGNVVAPVNTGGNLQIKSGPLGATSIFALQGIFGPYSNGIFNMNSGVLFSVLGSGLKGIGVDGVGNFSIADGNQAAGKVLTSDISGVATWQPISVPKTVDICPNIASNQDQTYLAQNGLTIDSAGNCTANVPIKIVKQEWMNITDLKEDHAVYCPSDYGAIAVSCNGVPRFDPGYQDSTVNDMVLDKCLIVPQNMEGAGYHEYNWKHEVEVNANYRGGVGSLYNSTLNNSHIIGGDLTVTVTCMRLD